MYLTEEEAKHKWCPEVRICDGIAPFAFNKHQGPEKVSDVPNRCIASDCMMWRWREDAKPDGLGSFHTKGYCGLAGRPE